MKIMKTLSINRYCFDGLNCVYRFSFRVISKLSYCCQMVRYVVFDGHVRAILCYHRISEMFLRRETRIYLLQHVCCI